MATYTNNSILKKRAFQRGSKVTLIRPAFLSIDNVRLKVNGKMFKTNKQFKRFGFSFHPHFSVIIIPQFKFKKQTNFSGRYKRK